MSTAVQNKRAKAAPAYGVGHGGKPHVAKPATLDDFLKGYGISRERYEKVVRRYLGDKPSPTQHSG